MTFAAQQAGVAFCPLGATKKSLVPGSPWAEISIHDGYEFLASRAIQEARTLGIVPIASVVWNGFDDVDLERIGDEYRVDAVLFRALRKEGRSERAGGISRVWRRANADLRGWKPIKAYPGLENLDGYEPVCIDTAGQKVELFLP
jgi:hypothetical protein